MLNRLLSLGYAGVFATSLLAAPAAAQDDDEWGADVDADVDVDGDADLDTEGDGMDASADVSAEGDMSVDVDVPEEDGVAGLVLGAGQIGLLGEIAVNFSTENVGKPLSIAPDIWYGVSNELTVGLVHSNTGLYEYWGGLGNSLCVVGEDNGCTDLYNRGGLRALYQFQRGDLQLAADGGLYWESISPFALQLRAGLHGRYTSGKFGVEFTPAVHLGITERDSSFDSILVPVTVGFQATPQLLVGLQSGINVLDIANAGDSWNLPLGIGAMYHVDQRLSAGASLNFVGLRENTVGELDPGTSVTSGGTEFRTLNLVVGYLL